MKRKILKLVIGGVALGTALFFAPFLVLKIMALFFILGALVRILFWRRMFWYTRPMMQMAYADKIRNMSAEEYEVFKNKMNQMHGHCYERGFKPRWNKFDNTQSETK